MPIIHKFDNEKNTCAMNRIHVFNNVKMRFGLWKYTFLVMQKYGRDESVPYAWRNVRNQFRG